MKRSKINGKKIICIMIAIITIISIMGLFTTQAEASTYLIDKADLYSKGESTDFSYKGVPIFVEFIVYKKNGIEYPAYCLNRNLPGITENREYTVNVKKAVDNMAVWRAIINGYPFKTPKELSCNTTAEAFAATKMAVYDALYTYDWNDFEKITEAGGRILKAAETISKNARKSNQTKPIAKVSIQKIDEEWKVDEENRNNVSKTYSVYTNVNCSQYKVELLGEDSKNIVIQSTNGQVKNIFAKNENFKITIPISNLDKDGKFQIRITADMETYPILYGESPSDNFQDYALAAGNIEYKDVTIIEEYYHNDTKIKIVKKDAQTGRIISGAKFNVLNEQQEILYADVETNEEGIAIIENIIPGKYYIEEVQAPDGYSNYEGFIEIEIGLNETYTINVENDKNEEEKKQTENPKKQITIVGKKLPRTGY